MEKRSLSLDADGVQYGLVRISLDQTQYQGELTLNPGSFPKVEVELSALSRESGLRSSDQEIGLIHFVTTDGNYTCFDSMESYNSYYPRFVLTGTHMESSDRLLFRNVKIYYDTICSWFLQGAHSEINGPKVSYQSGFETVTAHFSDRIERLAISTKYLAKWVPESNQRTLAERVCVELSFETGGATLRDIPLWVRDFSNILSFLTGFPVSSNAVVGIPKQENHDGASEIYFTTQLPSRKFQGVHYALIQYRSIVSTNTWQEVIRNYFENREVFRHYWASLRGLLTYNDIWDYKILGVMATFENYVSRHAMAESIVALPNGIADDLRHGLKKQAEMVWSKHRGTEDYEVEHERVFDQIKRSIDRFSCRYLSTFREKIENALNQLPPEIKEVFAFSDEEFVLLKRLRNLVAHGVSLDYEKLGVGKIGTLENKVILFLLYFVNREMGISDELFIGSLHQSLNRYKVNSGINEVAVARHSRKVPFIVLDYDSIKTVTDRAFHSVVLIRIENENHLALDEEKTRLFQDYHRSMKGYRDLREFARSLYDEQDQIYVNYLGHGYLESPDGSTTMSIFNIIEVIRKTV